MDNEFPSNSNETRAGRPERKTEKDVPKKEVARVTRGKATLRKKPLRKKFIDAFRPEDNVGFFEHTILEVLVPSIKDAISYSTTSLIEDALGTSSRPRRSGGGRGGYTSYNRMGNARPRNRRDRDRDDDDRRPNRRDRDRDPVRDDREIILPTRVDCEEVLENLIELISTYDVATKRDLLSMIGEPHTFVDEDWGWTDLRGARIHKIGRDGYLLDLPRAESLD